MSSFRSEKAGLDFAEAEAVLCGGVAPRSYHFFGRHHHQACEGTAAK